MIKLFRNIRHRLLLENRFSRYLIYAIGEIILVVIGILIALQVNNWNENRKSELEKSNIISALEHEFQTNKALLEVQYKNVKDSNLHFYKVLNYAAGEDSSLPSDSLPFYISKSFYIGSMALVNSVQSEAVASGKLNLLSDSLKYAISRFQDDVNSYQRYQQSLRTDTGGFESKKLMITLSKYISTYNVVFPNRTLVKPKMFNKTDTELEAYLKTPEVYAMLYSDYLDAIGNELWDQAILADTRNVLEMLDKEVKISNK